MRIVTNFDIPNTFAIAPRHDAHGVLILQDPLRLRLQFVQVAALEEAFVLLRKGGGWRHQ